MRIGIICASMKELAPFLDAIENCTTTEKAMLKFYQGEIHGVPVVALFSGVCKVNAAIAAQLLIDIYSVDGIINAGTAGGMDERLRIFDTVISTQAAYHDVAGNILTEYHPWMPSVYFDADKGLLGIAEKALAGRSGIWFGKMVTGEKFIVDEARPEINQKYAPLSVDMETAAIAHVCYVNRVPFLAFRTITDTAVHSGDEHFKRNCAGASAICKDVVLDFLDALAAGCATE